ncbi:hypothetical protein U9M49_21185 [Cytobacillus sp. OWB-43]|uniref:hypothetical protein n=1 Tax=Cytobacillus sp. OWB-43 TaxID=3108468 RepID=UPI002AFED42E|nr:hypothetical protein [Cytobacillus sp. OWB-43]MEA1855580.1 hypothetical protein [Cytobacillus sp. OWB-43]
MFDIQITGTNIRYADGDISVVHVQFRANDPESTVTLNGYIPISAEDYQGNESIPALKNVVRTKLIERLTPEAD